MTNKRVKRAGRFEGFVHVIDQYQLSNEEVLEIIDIDDLEENKSALSMLLDAVREGKAELPDGWFEGLRDGILQAIEMGARLGENFNDQGHPVYRARKPKQGDWFNRIAVTQAMLTVRGDLPAFLFEPEVAGSENGDNAFVEIKGLASKTAR